MFSTLFRSLALFILTPLLCAQQEYFVSPDGADSGSGLSTEAALATIQTGVERLQPGDTLTILPGEYYESVRAEGVGDDQHETVIRAALPRTAMIRGDVTAPDFVAVLNFELGNLLDGLDEGAPLPKMPYGNLSAVAIAWAICRNTTMPRRWIAERLNLRTAGNVSGRVRRFESIGSGELEGSLQKWKAVQF